MHILLVEDQEANACLYVRWLTEADGHTADVRLTGLEGLQAALDGAYQAYLIDLDLPDMDGLQVGLALARHMQSDRLPRAPIIAVTARADTSTRQEAARLGFDAMICKPFTGNDLKGLLAHFLTTVADEGEQG